MSGLPDVQMAPARRRSALRSPWLQTLVASSRFKRTWIGLALTAVVVAVALLGPMLSPYSPSEFVAPPYEPPSNEAWLGTDYLGRDVLSRFLWGGRSVLGLSILATVFGLGLGILVGLISAYMRNWIDDVLMRAMDVLLAFPQIVFVLLLISSVGPQLWLIVLTVGLSHAPRVARVTRGAALEVVERDFVKSAEALGETRWSILVGELLPNISSPLLVEFGLRLTYSIGLVAAVSFLGFGLQPPAADWGLMINENRVGLNIQPWPVVLPVIAVGLLTVGTNLITDGIARAAIGIGRSSAA
jgi:peptide/nickel transport system permease protein